MDRPQKCLVLFLAVLGLACGSDGEGDGGQGAGADAGDPSSGTSAGGGGVSAGGNGGVSAGGGGGVSSGGGDGGGEGALCTSCDDSCVEDFAIESVMHVEGDIVYGDPPPAGGQHNGCWASWGVHVDAVRAENWVHNLEHGGVILLYDCPDGCAEEVAALADFASTRDLVLVSPYSEMPTRFAAVSWGHRLLADCLDLQAIGRFYEVYADQAPESITAEPPAHCM